MKKEKIVQFVCFVTRLELEDFFSGWEPYAKRLTSAGHEAMLHEIASGKSKNKYSYVSQHECKTEDFRFLFMKGRKQDHFPQHNARVVHAGGYIALEPVNVHKELKSDVKVIAFIDHTETDLSFYYNLPCRSLNVFAAYYESCVYSHVMEFFLQEEAALSLLEQLKTRTAAEAAIYRKCAV